MGSPGWRRLRSRLTGRASPALRRAAAGLLLDLQSLPGRVRDPDRRSVPWQTGYNVGAGDYREMGRVLASNLFDYGGVRCFMRVLDIGCGTGRVAAPLAKFLEPRADGADSYVGFDISRAAIAACRRQVRKPGFVFHHADIRNADYNPQGRLDGEAFRFPCEDASIDVAFATSVFTHMRPAAVRRYLAESARVLAPGGRLFFTAYVMDAERRAAPAQGRARMAFQPWTEEAWALEPARPERAIAFTDEALRRWLSDAGLRLETPPLRGRWSPPADYDGFQDLWVAVR